MRFRQLRMLVAAAFPAELVDLETDLIVQPRADVAAVTER